MSPGTRVSVNLACVGLKANTLALLMLVPRGQTDTHDYLYMHLYVHCTILPTFADKDLSCRNKYHQSENNAVMLLRKDSGCDELLMLNMFIFYGKDAESKGIPRSKQQHMGHECEVPDSGNRWMEETGFMVWQPYFIQKNNS